MIPFTLADATEIAEDFEDLKDTEFTLDSSVIYLIDDVAVCPFYEEDKNRFVENYYSTGNIAKSLEFYTGDAYDVLLFACNADDEADRVHMAIRAFVEERGIGYNFP